MPPSTPPLDFDHQKGDKMPTKHKEAIRQLHWFGKVLISQLKSRYKLGNSSIRRILRYNVLEEDQAGIAQTSLTADYSGRDRSYGVRGIGQNTTGLD